MPRAVKARSLFRAECDGAVCKRVERIIARAFYVFPREIVRAALADDDLAHADIFVVIDLHAESLCPRVAS